MQKKYSILSLGSVYLDINFPNFPLELLKPESEVVGEKYAFEIGGSAALSVRVGALLGLPTAFIGKVGTDIPGEILQSLFTKTGITPHFLTSENSTNLNVNYISPVGKTLFTTAGSANQSLTGEEIITQLNELLPQTQILYLGGFFKLTKLHPYYKEIISRAHQQGAQVFLDHGRIVNTVTTESKQLLKEVIEMVDIYAPSEGEVIETNIKPPITLIKRAENPSEAISSSEHVTASTFSVSASNTVGAGDSFNAGFITAYLEGQSLQECLTFANATAALKISGQSISHEAANKLSRERLNA